MMQLHFLSTADGTPLTKRFELTEEGLRKESYPHAYRVSSHAVPVASIEDFYVALVAHAQAGHCLLKGQLDRPLSDESRASHTDADTPTDWLVLDNDNLHHLEPERLMDLLELGDLDYIVQFSSSAGIEPGKRGYHVFALLDRPWSPADLKRRLRTWNLDVPDIRAHFRLSRSNNALRWPLDISVCQNDKLVYIAPPILGPGVADTLEGERIRLVQGTRRAATLAPVLETDDALRQRETAVLNALREDAGLPARTFETRVFDGETVVENPDRAQVTGRKEERGFVYLNLNGGDSWGYYHPVAAPEVLFNFKGEPSYRIEALLPDYYPQALQRAQETRDARQLERPHADIDRQTRRIRDAETNGGRFLLAFRDKATDQYHVGWIDPQARTHALDPIGSKAKINELFAQYGYPKIEIVPSADFRFEPASDALYDLEAGFVNRYTPSRYLKNAQRREDASVPPAIDRVVRHALGDDPQVVGHFLNWLAVLFRYRDRTQTAWIWQGTTGTGKGLLFQRIIRPLIGESYCRMLNLANLEEQFNGFAEGTVVLFVDEVDTDQVKQMPKLMARFKSWITESKIPLRAMRQDLREVPNHLNLILSSNQPHSMRVEANDRRFNVCPRQEAKLLAPGERGEELVARIDSELQAFADYLLSREADPALARTALDNEPKRLLQSVTQTAIEEVAQAMRNGDLGYFMEHRPLSESGSASRTAVFDGQDLYLRPIYREFLAAATAAAERGAKHIVRHRDLFAVFELLVGDMPKTKAKLAKRLGHQSLSIAPHARGRTTARGLGVVWKCDPDEAAAWRLLLIEETDGNAKLEFGRPPRPRDGAEASALPALR